MRYLTPEPIDPAALLAEARRDGDGGLALFVGVVRDENEGRAVSRLEYEAYGEMAERELAAIAARLAAAHGGARVLFRHRVGSLRVGDVAEDGYDAVILDCPPAASLLLENAYRAADEVVLPAKLDYLSLPALERTRVYVSEANAGREKPLRIDGVLPTFYDLRTHVSNDVLDSLREKFRKILTPIRINAALAEAPSLGRTIYDFDGSARGAVDYLLLAEELKLG